jgi:hypothetical protein
MRRIIVMLTVAAMMAVMLVAGTTPAVAAPGAPGQPAGGATQSRGCGDSFCNHSVDTPSGNSNFQSQTRSDQFALDPHEGGADVHHTKLPGEFVGHTTNAPPGNFNFTSNAHVKP